MDFILRNLIPVTVGTLAVTLVLLFIWHKVSSRWAHPSLAALGPSIVVAAVIGPTFNHMWAMKRDSEQRASSARTRHHDRLRPVIEKDAVILHRVGRALEQNGHLSPFTSSASIQQDNQNTWAIDTLSNDVGAHFTAFGASRAKLREDVTVHDEAIRNIVRTINARLVAPTMPESLRTTAVRAAL